MRLPDFPIQGGCVCRAVRYELSAPPLAVYNCHCKDCQRFSGAGWSMSMPVHAETFRRIDGEVSHFDKTADSDRVVRMISCPHCGTKLWNEPLSAPELVIVRAGTIDDMSWAKPVGNIWTASRAPWAEIDADLVNFEGQPPSRDPLYEAWQRHVSDQH